MNSKFKGRARVVSKQVYRRFFGTPERLTFAVFLSSLVLCLLWGILKRSPLDALIFYAANVVPELLLVYIFARIYHNGRNLRPAGLSDDSPPVSQIPQVPKIDRQLSDVDPEV